MRCPRCDADTHADRTYCPACKWRLSRPFSAQPPAAAGNACYGGIPRIQPGLDAFNLTPPTRADCMNRPQRRCGSPRRQRHQVPTNGNAVAVLPEEARWEAPPRFEVLELPVVQSSFDFSAAEDEAEQLVPLAGTAPVKARCQAGLFDAALILLAGGVFFGLFALLAPPAAGLGGQMGLERRDLLIYLLSGYSLATIYFGFFTLLGCRTPGMQYYGLRVVSFEGQPLSTRQGLWRAFGYMASTGSLLLGFFWALVDDRRLTWHDHISQTFITDRTVL